MRQASPGPTLAAAALLAAFALLAVTSMRQKNVTIDEITYLAAGTYHLRTGDFHYNQTNPALLKMVIALPLVALGAELPPITESPRDWPQVLQWQYARRFLYENPLDPDRMLFAARLATVTLAVLLGLWVFHWARSLYGPGGGLLALALYCFSPHILAHGRLGTQDLGTTLLLFGSVFTWWRLVDEPSGGRLLACGTLLGLAFAAKTPAVLVIPALLAHAAICVLRSDGGGLVPGLPGIGLVPPRLHRLRQSLSLAWILAGLAVVSLGVVNAVYGFQGSFSPWSSHLPVPVPLPSAYVDGIRFMFRLETVSGGVFFAGHLYQSGLWYLLPVSLVMKTPIPTLLLFGGALGWLCVRRRWGAELPMLLFVGSQLAVYMWFSHVTEGVRYLLPILPFLFVLTGSLVAPGGPLSGGRRWIAAALVAGTLASTLLAHPHYLPYFNRLAGGSENGYRLLAGSSVDWGQDLKGLARFLDERGIERIKLGYFGSGDADYYGIDYDYLPSVGLAPREPDERWWYELGPGERFELEPQTGWIAVSANLLHGQTWVDRMFGPAYDWLDAYEPVAQVGHSILVYHIDEPGEGR